MCKLLRTKGYAQTKCKGTGTGHILLFALIASFVVKKMLSKREIPIDCKEKWVA